MLDISLFVLLSWILYLCSWSQAFRLRPSEHLPSVPKDATEPNDALFFDVRSRNMSPTLRPEHFLVPRCL